VVFSLFFKNTTKTCACCSFIDTKAVLRPVGSDDLVLLRGAFSRNTTSTGTIFQFLGSFIQSSISPHVVYQNGTRRGHRSFLCRLSDLEQEAHMLHARYNPVLDEPSSTICIYGRPMLPKRVSWNCTSVSFLAHFSGRLIAHSCFVNTGSILSASEMCCADIQHSDS
jgi:hypothetical protein